MIIFWIIFVLIILVSLVLAYISMKDFRQTPEDFGLGNTLFLIKRPIGLTTSLLNSLHQALESGAMIVSFERLFKGGESALTIYGPKNILVQFTQNLDLVELEDYIGGERAVLAYELGTGKSPQNPGSLFSDFPKLTKEEQVWYQLVLQPQRRDGEFKCEIRVVVVAGEEARRKRLAEALQGEGSGFIKIPKPLTTLQMMDAYQKRSMMGKSYFKLTTPLLLNLVALPDLQIPKT